MRAVASQMTLISILKFLMQELEKIILINIGTNVIDINEIKTVS